MNRVNIGLSAAALGTLVIGATSLRASVAQAQPCERTKGFTVSCSCEGGFGAGCYCAPCDFYGGVWCEEKESETCDACGGESSQRCAPYGSCNCGGGGGGGS